MEQIRINYNQKQTLKDKLKALIEKIKEMPAHKKMVILSLIASGLIFVIGTIFIIGGSVFNVHQKEEEAAKKTLAEQMEELDTKLDENLNEYGYDNLESDIDTLEYNFENYDDDLKEIKALLDDFAVPDSSPVNLN